MLYSSWAAISPAGPIASTPSGRAVDGGFQSMASKRTCIRGPRIPILPQPGISIPDFPNFLLSEVFVSVVDVEVALLDPGSSPSTTLPPSKTSTSPLFQPTESPGTACLRTLDADDNRELVMFIHPTKYSLSSRIVRPYTSPGGARDDRTFSMACRI